MAVAVSLLDFLILNELGCPFVRAERRAAAPSDQQALRMHLGRRGDAKMAAALDLRKILGAAAPPTKQPSGSCPLKTGAPRRDQF